MFRHPPKSPSLFIVLTLLGVGLCIPFSSAKAVPLVYTTQPSIDTPPSSSELETELRGLEVQLTALLVQAGQSHASATNVFTQQLDPGSKGAEVSSLQLILKTLGFYTYPTVTGYFGPYTEAAVQRFQRAQGILMNGTPQTNGFGRVGPRTLVALNGLSATGANPGIPTQTAPIATGIVPASGGGGSSPATSGGVSISGGTAATATSTSGVPPILTSISANPTSTGATITWTTNEPADSTVNYGLTASYGSIATSSGLTTSHTITLVGLLAGTTYHFQAVSVDASSSFGTSSDQTFTTTAPGWVYSGASVDVDFADNQYYGDSLNNLVSISRSSAGYAQTNNGTLTSFGPNTLRQTDLGLLIEPAATNLLKQSQTFATSTWTVSRATVTTNAAVAPDGTMTANALVEDLTANNTHLVLATSSKSAAALPYTFSIYAKADGRTRINLQLDDGNANGVSGGCDISGQQIAYGPTTLTGPFTNPSMAVTPLANGWTDARSPELLTRVRTSAGLRASMTHPEGRLLQVPPTRVMGYPAFFSGVRSSNRDMLLVPILQLQTRRRRVRRISF